MGELQGLFDAYELLGEMSANADKFKIKESDFPVEQMQKVASITGEINDGRESGLKLYSEENKQRALSILGSQNAAGEIIKSELNEAVAGLIASILQNVPFPFNLGLAAGAGTMVQSLYSKIPGFAKGGAIYSQCCIVGSPCEFVADWAVVYIRMYKYAKSTGTPPYPSIVDTPARLIWAFEIITEEIQAINEHNRR